MDTLKIEFVKLSKHAMTPERQNKGDAGYDLYAVERMKIKPMCRQLVNTGLSIQIPEGYYGRIAPRSGLAYKSGIDVMAGVIDSNYRGEIKVLLMNLNFNINQALNPIDYLVGSVLDFCIKPGDRIAQLIIEKCHDAKWLECTHLEDSEREGGFGSTGV